MQKKKIEINIDDFPQELHYIFQNANLYDSSSNPNAQVIYSDLGYYVKITEKGNLKQEAELAGIFEQKAMGVSVVSYISCDKDYLVTRSARGEDALHYLDHPQRLCEVLAEAMKYLHRQPITDLPISPCMEAYADCVKENKLKMDTFIHGDFCLPNVIFDNWNLSAFIDVASAGIGDKHIDIYWALWSLQYNLKTDGYSDYFLDLYGRGNIDMDALKLVAKVESES